MVSAGKLIWIRGLLLAAIALLGCEGYARAETWQELVASAEKDGSLTVLIPPLRKHRAVIEGFKAAFPKITLNLVGQPAGDFEPRIEAERKAGLYNWDVMVTGQGLTAYDLYLPNHWLASIRDVILPENAKDELWLGGYDSSFTDNARKYLFGMQATRPVNVYVNRSIVPENELRTLSDITGPQWKGRIAMNDPRVSGPGSSVATRLVLAFGEEGVSNFFRDQKLTFTTTGRQLAEWMIHGQYPIGLGVSDEELLDYQRRGLGTDIKPIPGMPDSVTSQWAVISLFNNAPHPDAAKLFINWMLSKETQSEWSKQTGTNSRRLDAVRGDPDNVVDANTWINGFNLSVESTVPIQQKRNQLLGAVLK